MQLGAVQGRDIGNGRDERVEGVGQTEWHDESLSTFDFEVEVNETDLFSFNDERNISANPSFDDDIF